MNGDIVQVSKPYEVCGKIIYMSVVTSNGVISGEEWIRYFEDSSVNPRCRIPSHAKSFLCSDDFKPTTINITSMIAIVPASAFDYEPSIGQVREYFTKHNIQYGSQMTYELGCLIRKKLTDKDIRDIGLGEIVIMHEPNYLLDGYPTLLTLNTDGNCFDTCFAFPGASQNMSKGFAGLVSQVRS